MMKGLLFSASLCLEKCRFTVSGEQVQLNFNHGDSPVYSVNLSILSTCDLCLHRVYHAFQQWTSPWSNLKRVAVFASKKRFPWAPVTQRHANTPPETYLSWRSQKSANFWRKSVHILHRVPGEGTWSTKHPFLDAPARSSRQNSWESRGIRPPMPHLPRKQPALLRDYLPPRGGGTLPIACWCNLDEWPLQHWLCYPWISIKRI